MNEVWQEREKIDLEENVEKPSLADDIDEPDSASLAAVEREEKEKESVEDYEDFSMDAIKLYLKRYSKNQPADGRRGEGAGPTH